MYSLSSACHVEHVISSNEYACIVSVIIGICQSTGEPIAPAEALFSSKSY